MTTSAMLSALRAAGACRQQITASTLGKATGSHVFRIERFTQIRDKVANGTNVESGLFSVGGHDWRIRCYPNGDEEQNQGYLSLYLMHQSHARAGDVTAGYEISILDRAWKPSCTITSSQSQLFTGDGWGRTKFMKLEDLDKEKYLKDDCLSVLCNVDVDQGLRTEDYTDEVTAAEEVKSVPPPFELHGAQLAEVIWNKQPADVRIEVVGGDGQTLAAHRWVLEARSPVFKADLALVSKDTVAELRIDGMDLDVCKALLQFIYTDSPPPELESAAMAERLLVAADRYELEKLKLVCEEALCKNIDKSSVAAALALAERHSCPVLRETCMRFLSSPDNLNAVVASSDGFDRLKKDCSSVLLELVDRS